MSQAKQTVSVPNQLLQMMTLILGGINVEDSNLQQFTHVATNLAQLIRFNSVKFKRGDDVSDMRHSLKNEPSFPVPKALLVYATTRKKCLVNQLAHEGLCVKYNRFKNINKSVAIQLCDSTKMMV